MSCLSPIAIPKLTGTNAAIIPCGKCPECLRNKANQFAVRIVRESEGKKMWFITLTYADEHMPIQKTTFKLNMETGELDGIERAQVIAPNNKQRQKFYSNAEYEVVYTDKGKAVRRYKPYYTLDSDGYACYFPTTDNRDVQKAIKRLRKRYDNPRICYVAVPEYGGTTLRPHYHLILIGWTRNQVYDFCADWEKRYGYIDMREIGVDLTDRSKVAKYISTYTFKGNFDCNYIAEGLCAKPHRCCSQNFGEGEDYEELVKWLKCEDKYGEYDPDDKEFIDAHPDIVEDVISRRFYSINGFRYPLPRYIKDKIFFKNEERETFRPGYKTEGIWEKKTFKTATYLQTLVVRALFEHLRGDADRKQRELEQKIREDNSHSVSEKYALYEHTQEDALVVAQENFKRRIRRSAV